MVFCTAVRHPRERVLDLGTGAFLSDEVFKYVHHTRCIPLKDLPLLLSSEPEGVQHQNYTKVHKTKTPSQGHLRSPLLTLISSRMAHHPSEPARPDKVDITNNPEGDGRPTLSRYGTSFSPVVRSHVS